MFLSVQRIFRDQSPSVASLFFARPVCCAGQSGLRQSEEPSLGTGYIARVRKIKLIEAGYRDLVRKSRSRAGASRDDCLFLLHVILMIQARIAIFGAF